MCVIVVEPGEQYFTFIDPESTEEAELTEYAVRELFSLHDDEKRVVAEWLKEQAER